MTQTHRDNMSEALLKSYEETPMTQTHRGNMSKAKLKQYKDTPMTQTQRHNMSKARKSAASKLAHPFEGVSKANGKCRGKWRVGSEAGDGPLPHLPCRRCPRLPYRT